MQKPYFLYLLPAIVLLLSQSCQTTGPVSFGNRKFYPDPAKNALVRQENDLKAQPGKITRTETSPETAEAEPAMLKTAAQPVASQLAISEKQATEKAASARAGKETKPGLRERLATKMLKMTGLAKNLDFYNINTDKKTPGSAIAGFVLGLLGVFIAGLILGTMGIIFSAIALSKDSAEYRKGLAIAGLVLGIIAVIGALVFIAAM